MSAKTKTKLYNIKPFKVYQVVIYLIVIINRLSSETMKYTHFREVEYYRIKNEYVDAIKFDKQNCYCYKQNFK